MSELKNHVNGREVYFDGIILDLDGVITRTASVHAAAWKRMFDHFLEEYPKPCKPFETETDYPQYVDGKPRYDGVRSFLESRHIDLPIGNPDDSPDQDTVCGLGNRKNQFFLNTLRDEGADIYPSTIQLIKDLRQQGTAIAVVSSSRNGREVLEAAGIAGLFDARVDGVQQERLSLQGKPAPDIFVEASRRLHSTPQRCIGVEDSLVGVQAAKAAGLACVIGIDRARQEDALYENGADIVVSDLDELILTTRIQNSPRNSQLPRALDCIPEMVQQNGRLPTVFLDYDGTLTPIVDHPDDAFLSDAMGTVLKRLADVTGVAVISGRDLPDVSSRVALDNIWYAGSHGFDIKGPGGQTITKQAGREFLPLLEAAEEQLREKLTDIPGCFLERKMFSIATHYRQVPDEHVKTVKQKVDAVHNDFPELRLSAGKKVRELQPDIDWNKGKALRWLMRAMEVDTAHRFPMYLGDDITDEDAFRELKKDGTGILVATEPQATKAKYRLADPSEVQIFLSRLSEELEQR